MSAWQHPMDTCRVCEQDILLRPEITPDLRLLYVRHCAHCDGGEPLATRRERIPTQQLEAQIWGANRVATPPRDAVDVRAAAAAMWTDSPATQGRPGLELWWDGDGDGDGGGGGGGSPRMTSMDARWARFVAPEPGEADGEGALVLPGDGSFAFGAEGGAGRRRSGRRRSPLRLRRSA